MVGRAMTRTEALALALMLAYPDRRIIVWQARR